MKKFFFCVFAFLLFVFFDGTFVSAKSETSDNIKVSFGDEEVLNLGYSVDLINQNLNGKKLVDDNLYKKEYEKLHNKLSKKYSGKELEYKLKQKMYQKGFSVSNFE